MCALLCLQLTEKMQIIMKLRPRVWDTILPRYKKELHILAWLHDED